MAKKRKYKEKHHKNMLIISVILLIFAVGMGYDIRSMKQKIAANEVEKGIIASQIEDEEEEKEILEKQREYLKSDAYLEDVAREKLKLLYENELILKKKK